MSGLIERIRIWSKRSNHPRREATSKARLAVESLEERALMDASFGASLLIPSFKDIPAAALHSSRSATTSDFVSLPAVQAARTTHNPVLLPAVQQARQASNPVAGLPGLIARTEVETARGPRSGLPGLIALPAVQAARTTHNPVLLPAIQQARPVSSPVAGLPGLIAVEHANLASPR